MKHPILPRLFASALMFSLPAMARQSIDETRPASTDVRIHVENVTGDIMVTGWDRQQMHITGSLGDKAEKLAIDGDKNRWNVEVKYPRKYQDRPPTKLILHVPHGARLDLESVSADIDVQKISGKSLRSKSVSGDIKVSSSSHQISLQSVSGDVHAEGKTVDSEFESVSGDITVSGARDEVSLSTVSGDVLLEAGELSHGKFDTVSGNLILKLGIGPEAGIKIESMSGDVRLSLPKKVSARIRAETFSGDIRAPHGDIHKSRHGPGASWKYTAGNGDGEVTIHTFSGDITLHQD